MSEQLLLERAYERILNERVFHYSIPRDRKLLMYDFYVIAFLNQFDLNQKQPGRKVSGFGRVIDSPTMRYELDENTKDSFLNTKERIIKYLESHMLDAVFYAICCEFPHVLDLFENLDSRIIRIDDSIKNDIEKVAGQEGVNLLVKYAESLNRHINQETATGDEARSYGDFIINPRLVVEDIGIDRAEFISLAQKIFLSSHWIPLFGGKPWSNICGGWLRLYNASTEDELIIAIDHVYDLQHNTNSVFNKLKSYYDEYEQYDWIGDALDLKANLISPYALILNASQTLFRMALRILKSEGYEGWNQFIKSIGSGS